ncbi:LuxR family transcriptional regulator [Hymenobacter sp. UV11]|uniref:helix-turn-helix domain-containing protein n=1 Tax=Hymenobacter sp. UV11 TaxID=1849735 RepID=UPI00105BDE56|nr:helix-turn-helix transcriptional regulator [Hymenobacter sp. UV11]TDN35767.1 hypothetical protein A8B98_11970 [Hymenobacter sp. UV11]TFZ67370.1 LuxR family transcriptional regulator [Hymenobacter sp. UV11]
MTDANLIATKICEVAVTADLYPGVVILLNSRTQGVEYMSARGLSLLQISLPELRALGAAYHSRFFNAEESVHYVPRIWELLNRNDPDLVISFFQQVRTTQSPDWSWYCSSMRLLLRDTSGLPLLLICMACPVAPQEDLAVKVNLQRLLDESHFLRAHHGLFATLTCREREVLRRSALGQSAPEIATELFISPKTAETHRRNLRRKLQAESTFVLSQYARVFDLI